MSHPVPATLYRIAAAAGCGSAVVLLINAAKRAEIIPTSALSSSSLRSHRSWRWPSSPPSTSPLVAAPAPSALSPTC